MALRTNCVSYLSGELQLLARHTHYSLWAWLLFLLSLINEVVPLMAGHKLDSVKEDIRGLQLFWGKEIKSKSEQERDTMGIDQLYWDFVILAPGNKWPFLKDYWYSDLQGGDIQHVFILETLFSLNLVFKPSKVLVCVPLSLISLGNMKSCSAAGWL